MPLTFLQSQFVETSKAQASLAQNHLSKKTKKKKKKFSSAKIQNTHTLNKINQFYISKTSQDSLVSIH